MVVACEISVCVQLADFDVGQQAQLLRSDAGVGAIVTFSGLVRDYHGDQRVDGLFLEHYPGMTENSLREIAAQAAARWPLSAIRIIHRIGELRAGDQIVFVGVASAHRGAAFAGAEFVMDYLKTQAPFWKKSLQGNGAQWVDAKDSDATAAERWGDKQ